MDVVVTGTAHATNLATGLRRDGDRTSEIMIRDGEIRHRGNVTVMTTVQEEQGVNVNVTAATITVRGMTSIVVDRAASLPRSQTWRSGLQGGRLNGSDHEHSKPYFSRKLGTREREKGSTGIWKCKMLDRRPLQENRNERD